MHNCVANRFRRLRVYLIHVSFPAFLDEGCPGLSPRSRGRFDLRLPNRPTWTSALACLHPPVQNDVALLTDRAPRRPTLLAAFLESDRSGTLDIPQDDRLKAAAKSIESALAAETAKSVRQACAEFLAIAAEFYEVQQPDIRILAVRPIRGRESGWATELFGDYAPETGLIRVWMRTAVRKQVTSFGTLLSTLCHEFCHHLDYKRFRYPDSWHTRGFYERTAALYHHVRGTPAKRLCWIKVAGGRWRIDWVRTNRSL